MIKDGVPASTILVITFTTRAKDELRDRLDELIGPVNAKAVTVGTFHSVCARILRQANNSTVMVYGIQIQGIPCSNQYGIEKLNTRLMKPAHQWPSHIGIQVNYGLCRRHPRCP